MADPAAHGDLGDLERAGGDHRQALSLAQEIDRLMDEAHSYAGLGRIDAAAGRPAGAAEHLRTALALFTKGGIGEVAETVAKLDEFGPARASGRPPD